MTKKVARQMESAPRLRAILIEDSPDDADLIELALESGGVRANYARAENLKQLTSLLESSDWDFVISDYSLPQFGVTAALEAIRERGLDLPFIVVSGRYGEEKAVETMRAGAQDYVPKDRLVRLAPAVERELKEAAHRRERRELERHLGVSDPMRLFGRVAASLAHELNNPLTFLHAGLGVLSQRLAEIEDSMSSETYASLTSLVERLIVGTARIGAVSADFRALGAAEDEPPQVLRLDTIVDHCVKLVALEFRRRARVRVLPGDSPVVELKPGKLKQALVGVLMHIAQRLPRGATEAHEVTVRSMRKGPDRVEIVFEKRRFEDHLVPGDESRVESAMPLDYCLFLGRQTLEMIGGKMMQPPEWRDNNDQILVVQLPCRLDAAL